MNAIVSVTSDWGIGLEGGLLVRNPADMRFFRERTMGGTVVCGRSTYESFPGGALKGRRNVVLSGDLGFVPGDADVVRSVEEALAAVEGEDPDAVWLIGGERVYRQLLDCCQRTYVTKNEVVLAADAFFPNLDEDPSWRLVSTDPGGVTPGGVSFSFCVYARV